jgi:hypothetical protein
MVSFKTQVRGIDAIVSGAFSYLNTGQGVSSGRDVRGVGIRFSVLKARRRTC